MHKIEALAIEEICYRYQEDMGLTNEDNFFFQIIANYRPSSCSEPTYAIQMESLITLIGLLMKYPEMIVELIYNNDEYKGETIGFYQSSSLGTEVIIY